MSTYRKLLPDEVKNLMNTKTEGIPKWVNEHLKEYYPSGFSKVTIIIDSDYNDEGYNNSVVGLVVFNEMGYEISPKKGKEVEARKAFLGHEHYETSYEPMENESYIVGGLPDLYVMEKT
jgi:hypothetical protein